MSIFLSTGEQLSYTVYVKPDTSIRSLVTNNGHMIYYYLMLLHT